MTAKTQTKKAGRPAGTPAVPLRASEDIMPMLMQIRHAMELKTGKPVGMRSAVDFAIKTAHKGFVSAS